MIGQLFFSSFFVFFYVRTISHYNTAVILIMHYNPTLRHIPAPAMCTRPGGSLTVRTTPAHFRSISNTATNFTDLGRSLKTEDPN